MYHMYEAETQNEEFDWHIYAENNEDAYKMMVSFNDCITQECRKLAYSIHYESIAPELKSGVKHRKEKKEIERFFSQFYKPVIKNLGIVGGYVLDYRQCSIRGSVQMPYSIMLSYLDMIQNTDFFDSVCINPVYVSHQEINLPDHDVRIKLTIGMEKRYAYGNEALLGVAGTRLDFKPVYVGEDAYGSKDFFQLRLKNVSQFCQFLNYFPFVYIYKVSYM